MSHEDPPRLLDDPATPDAVRAAMKSFEAASPAYDAATVARTSARIATLSAKSALWTKLAAVTLLLAAAIPAARWLGRGAQPTPTPSHAPVPLERAPAIAAPSRAEPPAPQLAHAIAASPPAEPSAQPSGTVAPPRARATAVAASPAPLERDLLADAQRALERDRDPQRALDLIREHRRRYARSQLDEERSYLALRAYARLSDHAALSRAGTSFLQRFPRSIYAPAARRLLGASP
ncbi:MAG: hypothetical protein U0269_37630 [Polyangiales bacterium]